jgi:hypothetical protein
MADDVQLRLARRFRKQQEFAAATSPLTAHLCGVIADWLDVGQGGDPLVDWLLAAGKARASFDVPLLLLAGLHRDILAGCPEVQGLARSFPSAGGSVPPAADDLAPCLRQAILARREPLAEFLATATIQTNETARGLCWLLPLVYTGWPAIHLVDLGASAGLNLVADQRHYRLLDTTGQLLLELGYGTPDQFAIACAGPWTPPTTTAVPCIRSRLGCDLAPLVLRSPEDEQALAAFVWGDQVERMSRLHQGIAALHATHRTAVPVQLDQANLPDDLPRFLEARVSPRHDAPLVLSTTYLTTYLHDKGATLRPLVAAWAQQQKQPVLWLQWETLWQGPQPPVFGWVGWSGDLWMNGRHHHWHLAWVHPHGTQVQWLTGMNEWAAFWTKHSPMG